jgi:hypothetical protein
VGKIQGPFYGKAGGTYSNNQAHIERGEGGSRAIWSRPWPRGVGGPKIPLFNLKNISKQECMNPV